MSNNSISEGATNIALDSDLPKKGLRLSEEVAAELVQCVLGEIKKRILIDLRKCYEVTPDDKDREVMEKKGKNVMNGYDNVLGEMVRPMQIRGEVLQQIGQFIFPIDGTVRGRRSCDILVKGLETGNIAWVSAENLLKVVKN
jgi:hypothetical protein